MNIRVRKNTARHIDQLGNYWCLKKGANLWIWLLKAGWGIGG